MSDIFELFKKISGDSSKTPSTSTVEWIIVGLGNIGREYDLTRHNIGFMCANALTMQMGINADTVKFKASVGRGEINGHGVLVMFPRTYMNNSGEAVREAAAFYKVDPEHILVLVDDIYLDVGRLRIRRDGTDGGHNGLKSIIYQLNSDKFPRIRMGVGKKPAEFQLVDWVLSKFTDPELLQLKKVFGSAMDGIKLILDGKYDEAMQYCNGFKA